MGNLCFKCNLNDEVEQDNEMIEYSTEESDEDLSSTSEYEYEQSNVGFISSKGLLPYMTDADFPLPTPQQKEAEELLNEKYSKIQNAIAADIHRPKQILYTVTRSYLKSPYWYSGIYDWHVFWEQFHVGLGLKVNAKWFEQLYGIGSTKTPYWDYFAMPFNVNGSSYFHVLFKSFILKYIMMHSYPKDCIIKPVVLNEVFVYVDYENKSNHARCRFLADVTNPVPKKGTLSQFKECHNNIGAFGELLWEAGWKVVFSNPQLTVQLEEQHAVWSLFNKQPFKLKQLCRNAIRNNMRIVATDQFQKLPVPQSMKEYIMLCDVLALHEGGGRVVLPDMPDGFRANHISYAINYPQFTAYLHTPQPII